MKFIVQSISFFDSSSESIWKDRKIMATMSDAIEFAMGLSCLDDVRVINEFGAVVWVAE